MIGIRHEREHDISVLTGLATTTLDSMKGYEDTAESAQSTRFASMFADFARDRGGVALRGEIAQLGGGAGDWWKPSRRCSPDLS